MGAAAIPAGRRICARHAPSEATFTCSRCGIFGCPVCESTVEAGVCEGCEQKRSAQVGQGMGIGALIGRSIQVVANNAGTVALIAFIEAAVLTLFNLAQGSAVLTLVLFLPVLFVFNLLMATWTSVLATRARGEPVKLGVELRHNMRFAAPLMLSTILVSLAVGTGLLLLVIPGLVLWAGWSVYIPCTVLGNSETVGALGDSWALTRGSKLQIAIASVVLFALVAVVQLIALPALVLFSMTMGVPGVLVSFLASVVNAITMAPFLALPAIVWLRLRGLDYQR